MDVNILKGRIVEAFVEAIFRRAMYHVTRAGRESTVHGLMKVGATEFAPDFLVWKQVTGESSEPNLHRLFAIEVKYRWNPEDFVRKEIEVLAAATREQWPHLYLAADLLPRRGTRAVPDAGPSEVFA